MNALVKPSATLDAAGESEEAKFLWPPLVIAVFTLWLLPLPTSLELDETGVWWVVKDGLRQAFDRAHVWPLGQSIIYDSLLVAARRIAGDSDAAMRLPSVLAMIGALYLLYRLGNRLIGPLAAMFACLVFVTTHEIVYIASTMRPYALVPVCVLGAVLALMNWLDSGRMKYGMAYIALAALSVHVNYFAGLILPVHAILVFQRIRARTARIGIRQSAIAVGAILVLLTPLVPFLLRLRAATSSYSYLVSPEAEDLLSALAPPLLAGAVALAVLACLACRLPVLFQPRGHGGILWFLATWMILPIAILFAVSVFSQTKVFAPRYFVSSMPAFALLAGYLLSALGPRQVRLAVAATLTLSAILVFDVNEGAMRGAVGWREAAQAVRESVDSPETPVIVVPGFHEGDTVKAALDPAITDGVFAPYLRYPLGGKLVRVPWDFEPDVVKYVDKSVIPLLAGQSQFFVVGLSPSQRYTDWLQARCAPLGFALKDFRIFGGVGVTRFERAQSLK